VAQVRVDGNGRDETFKKYFPLYITPAPWSIGGIINDWRDAPVQVADEGDGSTAESRSANVHFVESGGKLTKKNVVGHGLLRAVATTDISGGEELYLDYRPHYWT